MWHHPVGTTDHRAQCDAKGTTKCFHICYYCYRIADVIFKKKGPIIPNLKPSPHCYALRIHQFFVNVRKVFQAPDPTVYLTEILIKVVMDLVIKDVFFSLK